MLNRAQPPGFGVGRSELYRGDSSLSRRECLQSGGAFCSCQSPDAVDASGEAKKVDHGPMFVGYALLQSLIWLRITLAPLLCVPKTMYGRRPRCKREIDYQRSVRVRSCMDGARGAREKLTISEAFGCGHVWTAPAVQERN